MTVMSTVAVVAASSAPLAVTAKVVRVLIEFGVPAIPQVLAIGTMARPVGKDGAIEHPVAELPELVNRSGATATVVTYVCAD